MKMPTILSCGEVLWDLFPDGECFGGAPANFACHAAILGAQVSMFTAVGNDLRGDKALAILQGFKIDTSLIQRVSSAPTGSVGVSLDAAGKPTFEIHTGSAWDHIALSSACEAKIAKADAVYFGTLGQRSEMSRQSRRQGLTQAEKRGILRVLDVNLRKPFYDASLIRESIEKASVLKLSDDELPEIAAASNILEDSNPENTLRSILKRFDLDLVVMTHGAKGAILVSATETFDQPGIPTKVVDTVGAGDAFTAAFVLGLLRGEANQDILRKACETASAVCSIVGAVPTL